MIHLTLLIGGLGVLGIQYFLSRRENAFWGAILPATYLSFFIYGSFAGIFEEGKVVSFVGAVIGGTVLLLSVWINGRKSVKEKRDKELEKIKLYDL